MSTAARGGWVCPGCHRSFAQRRARHSCDRQSVRQFFAGRPGLFELFEELRARIERLGPVEVAATRSQISFKARIRFAWVWLPQQYLRQAREDALVLTFDLDRHLRSRRIKSAVEVRPHRWTHHLVLTGARQLDREVLGWLRAAHALAG